MLIGRIVGSLLCALVIWQFFRLNREPEVRVSKALWIPTIWLFLAVSRNVSQWLQLSSGPGGYDQYLEGSPLDRAVLSIILALGVIVLVSRGRRVGTLLQSNFPILLYFLYCGVSFVWSDFPDVSFKRWFRAIGDLVVVLIVLSDRDWLAALKRLLARLGFVVVPLSVLFIRYFPEYGRSYTHAGQPTWCGVATDKNALGLLCLIFGLAAVFRFLTIYRGEEEVKRTAPLIAQGVLIAMTFYLLYEANSATAFACYFLAGIPMILTFLYRWARKPVLLHSMVLTALGVAFSALFLGIGTGLVQDLGRDSTLTGRTEIWHYALPMVPNSLIGAGFESFWLGDRITDMSRLINQGVNQAHNGYIEIYLNLGWVGVALIATLLVTGYRRIARDTRSQTQAGSLRLAYFMIAVAYNFTEGGFKMMHPVWIAFLLAIAIVPKKLVLGTPERGGLFLQAESSGDPSVSTRKPAGQQRGSPDLVPALGRR